MRILNVIGKLFDNNETNQIDVIGKENQSNIIQLIHKDFDTEVDRLLEYAKVQKPLQSIPEQLKKNVEGLRKAGFTSSKVVRDFEVEEEKRLSIKKENEEKQELIEVINYFSFKYPNYKFITEEGIKRICEKYGLVYASVDKYIGYIPQRNIDHILNFKIKEEDEAYYLIERRFRNISDKTVSVETFSEIENTRHRYEKRRESWNKYPTRHPDDIIYPSIIQKAPLYIAANIKDFDANKVQVIDYKLQDIPDPVVFHPVVYNRKEYFLIVTAWGDEASDELVVNHKFN